VIPVFDSQARALWLAFISTGSVIKLKRVVSPKRTMPASKMAGKVLTRIIPRRRTHCIYLEAKLTGGTSFYLKPSHA